MPTNPNMVAIQTVTVGSGGAATISFTSIPQTYTDLKIVLSGRTTQASLADSVYFSFNGSTSNFSGIILYGDGGSASSFTQARYAGSQPGSTATASTFANIEMYISNYTSSNNKAYSVDAVTENNATTAYAYTAGGLWSNSAAITSITLTPNAGSFVQHSTATLYGVTSSAYGAKATGGIITSDANYYYHTFLASGTFTPTSNITADYLVVAGGGGSYRDASGGGGAGGLRCTVGATGGGGSLESALSLTASTNYTVTIGAGGTGAANGSNSVFSTITSTGGGYGNDYEGNGASGGSGGGAGWDADAPDNAGGAGTTNQGYAGTKGFRVGAPTSSGAAGGGGGAGAAAGSASTGTGGAGGAGVQTSISGIATYYAGGGGGWGGTNGGAGGNGGGGAGYGGSASTGAGTNGTANTGGGAGGARGQNQSGGSGIVIVRYAK